MTVEFLQTKVNAFLNSYAFKKIRADFDVICAYVSGSNCVQTAYSENSDVDIIILVKNAGISFKSNFKMKHCHWMIDGLDLYSSETSEIDGCHDPVRKYFCLAQDYFVTADNIIYVNDDLRSDFEAWFNVTRVTAAKNSAAQLLMNCNELLSLSSSTGQFSAKIAKNAYRLAVCCQVIQDRLTSDALIDLRKCTSYDELAAAFENIDFGDYEWIKQSNYFAPTTR